MCPRSEEYEQTMVWSITFISIIWISSKIDVYFMLSCHQQMVIAWSVITDQRYKERDCFWSPKLNCISSFFLTRIKLFKISESRKFCLRRWYSEERSACSAGAVGVLSKITTVGYDMVRFPIVPIGIYQ